jgi:hypothetical protein
MEFLLSADQVNAKLKKKLGYIQNWKTKNVS